MMDISNAGSFMIETAKSSLSEAERKLRKSCAQITMLDKLLEDMTKRYTNAKAANFHRFRYNLRLKLSVVEGVRNMYYEYAFIQAEQIADLRRRLYGEIIEIVDGDSTGVDHMETV